METLTTTMNRIDVERHLNIAHLVVPQCERHGPVSTFEFTCVLHELPENGATAEQIRRAYLVCHVSQDYLPQRVLECA